MNRPLLPPRGAHLPARMINPLLPPAVTSMRGLAWGEMVTPPLRSQELAAFTGKRQAPFIRHMSKPRFIAALSWVSTGLGTIIVSGAVRSSVRKRCPIIHPKIPDSKNLESPHPPSSSSVPGFDSGLIPSEESVLLDSVISAQDVNRFGDGGGEEAIFSKNLESIPGILESRNLDFVDPVFAPSSLVHLPPDLSTFRVIKMV